MKPNPTWTRNLVTNREANHAIDASLPPTHNEIGKAMQQEIDALRQRCAELEADLVPLYAAPPNHRAVMEQALEALSELTDCGEEAWTADRPCVKDGRAAIAAIREQLGEK